jgi:hypothetical protein
MDSARTDHTINSKIRVWKSSVRKDHENLLCKGNISLTVKYAAEALADETKKMTDHAIV